MSALWSPDGHPTVGFLQAYSELTITLPELVRFNEHMIACVPCGEAYGALAGKAFETGRMDIR